MSKKYTFEREGQIDFFDNYGIDWKQDESILVDDTDGVFNGILLEFKLNISNLNKVLFQAVKYLSKMRIKGESVPATILLVDLNGGKAYQYASEDYREAIHEVYRGAASKDNDDFVGGRPAAVYEYGADPVHSLNLRHLLKDKKTVQQKFMPVDIDENCIVAWAERYYAENPTANKGDFLGDETGSKVKIKGEIREPRYFKGLINPYTGKTNEKFKYLMDCLNDRLSKKDLGAFYTPLPYARKAAELVKMAVDRIPEDNDYIILDRCAGTGNLEQALVGLFDRNGDELISHAVVSTYEYYEYKVLNERLGDLVRAIIPPTEAEVVYENGKISNADAMSEDFINNPMIHQYVDDPKCNVILFENPPSRDQSQKNNEIQTDCTHTDKSYCREEMRQTQKYGLGINDIFNVFVWSAYNHWLKKPDDYYVVLGPIKHWKRIHISDKTVLGGYVLNRQYFHASPSAISCLLIKNECTTYQDEIVLDVLDIANNEIVNIRKTTIRKTHQPLTLFYDKNQYNDVQNAICCNRDGSEALGRKPQFKPSFNTNMIGYLRANGSGFDANCLCLTRCGLYNGHGFYLRRSDYLNYLPLFCVKKFYFEKWYEKELYDTTSDGGDAYTHDPDFLKSCLIYTCLSNQNKCLTFDGSDGRHYQNELCFDSGTLASADLAAMILDDDEKELLELWKTILEEATTTSNYNPDFKYGVYQITKELNTFEKVKQGKSTKKIYDYPTLNGNLETLRVKLKAYYKSHITGKMFKYELLK